MSVHNFRPRMSAKTVFDAWKIARDEANAYQRMMNRMSKSSHAFLTCRAARDAASRIALKIRYGARRRHP